MRKFLTALVTLLWSTLASANVPCSVPFNLQNNTIADATQVMANYNALITCLGNAAAAGVNSDITALFGLTTPLSQNFGGTWLWVGGTSTGSANAQVVATVVPSTGYALAAGRRAAFLAGFTNSGATTLNVFGTGAVNVFKSTTAGPVALTGNEITTGNVIEVEYDGTQYQIINPTLALTAGWGIAVSGLTISQATTNPAQAFVAPVNFQLNVTVASNNLTIAVKGNNGADPSATNPVLVPFRDSTLGNGDPVWLALTAANSFALNAGSSLGATNNVAFRAWIVAFNNGGNFQLGVFNASTSTTTATTIFPLNEGNLVTSTLCNACGTATAVGTFYSNPAVSTKAFRIVGYFEYSAGLATAGTYNVAPTTVQLFGPGIKKPGDVVQELSTIITTQDSTNSGSFVALTNNRITITPTSAVNPIMINTSGTLIPTQTGGTNQSCVGNLRLSRGTTNNTNLIGNQLLTAYTQAGSGATITAQWPANLFAYDLPNTVNATTYAVQANQSGSNCTGNTSVLYGGTTVMSAKEIQG